MHRRNASDVAAMTCSKLSFQTNTFAVASRVFTLSPGLSPSQSPQLDPSPPPSPAPSPPPSSCVCILEWQSLSLSQSPLAAIADSQELIRVDSPIYVSSIGAPRSNTPAVQRTSGKDTRLIIIMGMILVGGCRSSCNTEHGVSIRE